MREQMQGPRVEGSGMLWGGKENMYDPRAKHQQSSDFLAWLLNPLPSHFPLIRKEEEPAPGSEHLNSPSSGPFKGSLNYRTFPTSQNSKTKIENM